MRYLLLCILLIGIKEVFGQTNTRPVAEAGMDTVYLSETFSIEHSFDATGSFDEDGSIAAYYWVFEEDTLSQEAVFTTTLTEPANRFKLIVADNAGDTDEDFVSVFIGHPTNYDRNRVSIRNGATQTFASGMNIAWHRFSNDLHGFEEVDQRFFAQVMDSIASNGGNALRWWLHTNGANSPDVTADGEVTGIDFRSIQAMKQVLDMAYDRGIMISMCLWSFDMLQNQNQDPTAMKRLLEDSTNIQSYIDLALLPILEKIGDHPAVMTWEIFNEPEGMTNEFGWSNAGRIQMSDVQRFVNMCAGAIHRKVPGIPVSNGCWSFRAHTDVENNYNYYLKERLIAAGGDQDGYLDFYQVHYYPGHMGNEISPFHRPASYWGLDAPIVIGEFPADTLGGRARPGYSVEEAYEIALKFGYAGVMSWSWTDTDFNKDFNTTARGLQAISLQIPNELILSKDQELNRVPSQIEVIQPLRMLLDNVVSDTVQFDLKTAFSDQEQGGELSFSITSTSDESVADVTITDESKLRYQVKDAKLGFTQVLVNAADNEAWFAEGKTLLMFGDKADHLQNMAYFQSTTSSSMKGGDFAVFANDGDPNTTWTARSIENEHLTIDMPEEPFNFLAINWKNLAPSVYHIEGSDDGQLWENLITETSGQGRFVTYAFDQARQFGQLRILLVDGGSQQEIGIKEIQIEHVSENQPPEVITPVEDLIQDLSTVRNFNNYIRFTEVFEDPEHTAYLDFFFENSNETLVRTERSIGGVGLSLFFQEGATGTSEITLGAIDPFGAMVTTSFEVRVFDDILSNDIEQPQVAIYPNPAQELLHIQGGSQAMKVRAMDTSGKELVKAFEVRPHELATVDIMKWPSGIYLIEIIQESQIWVKKVFKP